MPVDWNAPEELQKQYVAFKALIHTMLGLYLWEWFTTLNFDWAYVTGQKKFRWPMAFYFANRYVLLAAFISVVISFDATTEIDCQAIYIINQLAGDASVGLASINLALRTIAIWGYNRWVVGLLILVILGHWSLILQAVQIKAVYVPDVGCTIIESDNTILAAIFIYSMGFDLMILLMNTYKLLGLDSGKTTGTWRNNRLTKLIFEDGLIYFLLAFCANLLATVFMLIKLSEIMSVIFNFPAAVISSIAAMRVVRRLSNYSTATPEVFPTGNSTSTQQANRGNGTKFVASTRPGMRQNGVHVQMETFTRAEDQFKHGSTTKQSLGDSADDVVLDLESKGRL